jgi:hypothetical protein
LTESLSQGHCDRREKCCGGRIRHELSQDSDHGKQ